MKTMISQPIDQQLKKRKMRTRRTGGELKQKNEMLYKQYKYMNIYIYVYIERSNNSRETSCCKSTRH